MLPSRRGSRRVRAYEDVSREQVWNPPYFLCLAKGIAVLPALAHLTQRVLRGVLGAPATLRQLFPDTLSPPLTPLACAVVLEILELFEAEDVLPFAAPLRCCLVVVVRARRGPWSRIGTG